MKKYLTKIPALLLTLAIVFTATIFIAPEKASAACSPLSPEGIIDCIAIVPGEISILILKISSLLTYLAGGILNFAIKYTVVDMSDHIDGTGSINVAWSAIRDVANMAFIFILLWAAIQTVLGIGKDNKNLIVKVVLVAIFINFSLFATKLIIDAANVFAIYFYDAIAPGALDVIATTGLSDRLMNTFNLQSIWDATEAGLDGSKLLIIGVMGTVVTLIAAFVFFAIAIMFVIRFVVLIFVLILSPLAFLSFILPELDDKRKQWWAALTSQAFFAPVFFLLIWIVIVVSNGLFEGGGNMATALTGVVNESGELQAPSVGDLGILMNFIVLIVMLIASLIIAKDISSKAGPAVQKATKWLTGLAGGTTFGLAATAGRRTIGRAGQAVAESKFLQDRPESRAARLALAAGRKTGSASFDVRGSRGFKDISEATGINKDFGLPGGKGGYEKAEEEKEKRRFKEADRYKARVTYKDVDERTGKRAAGSLKLRDDRVKAAKDLIASDPTSRVNREEAEKQIKEAQKQYEMDLRKHRETSEKELRDEAEETTRDRKARFAENLSKTRLSTFNLYAGVKTDREASRRIMESLREKSKEDKAKDAAFDYLKGQYEKERKENETPPDNQQQGGGQSDQGGGSAGNTQTT